VNPRGIPASFNTSRCMEVFLQIGPNFETPCEI
jgi:hypothetical protein